MKRAVPAACVALPALLLAALLLMPGCGRPRSSSGRSRGGPVDSSFAALTFGPARSPRELSEAAGQVVYQRYCVICHGDSGQGDGFNAYNVKAAYGVTPTAFTDSAFSRVPEAEVLAAIRAGGAAARKSAAMPAWGHTLTPGEVEDVARYVRSLAPATHPR